MVMDQLFGCTIMRVPSTHALYKRIVSSETSHMFLGREKIYQEVLQKIKTYYPGRESTRDVDTSRYDLQAHAHAIYRREKPPQFKAGSRMPMQRWKALE